MVKKRYFIYNLGLHYNKGVFAHISSALTNSSVLTQKQIASDEIRHKKQLAKT